MAAQYAILDADLALNVFHVFNGGGWTTGSLTTLCETYAAWESTAIMGETPASQRTTSTTLQAVTARDLTTETGDEVTFTGSPIPVVGTGDPTAALPSSTSKAVKLYTGVPGKSYRGRVFWIDMVKYQLTSDPNIVTSPFLALLTAFYTQLIADMNGARAGNSMGVLSRYSNGVLRAAGILTPFVAAAIVNSAVDVQRRRLPYHARHR